ncbi:MAG: 2-dehydropantoate 2-reductase [bacterium]|nr:2-dehydropantoate 2-reductase [bacterium]
MDRFDSAIVFGAGAVGSYLGARLPLPTVLVARPDHVRRINEDGLRIGGQEEAVVRIPAAEDCPELGPHALVLVGVKLGDLESAAAALAPRLLPDTTVVALANGLRPEAILAEALGRPVSRIIVQLGATLDGPGAVSFWGGGLLMGPGEVEDELARLFSQAGLPVRRCEDLAPSSWRKLAMNCVANPLSLLTGGRNRDLVAPELDHVRQAVVDEVARLAATEGVELPPDTAASIDRALGRSDNLTSMLQDGRQGRSTEIEFMNGWVARRAEELGLEAPTNRMLAELVRIWVRNRPEGS